LSRTAFPKGGDTAPWGYYKYFGAIKFYESTKEAQWRSSHLAILALRQGRQAAMGRQNEAAQCTQYDK